MGIGDRSVLISEAFPSLGAELADLLRECNQPGLAAEVASLQLVDRCRCEDNFCATMYTAPPPKGGYRARHRSLALKAARGHLILDVVDDHIACVEILYRDEVRERLVQLLP